MPELTVFPPSPENEALFAQIPGLRQTPIPVVGFDGPEGSVGPEATGALLLLHMTMVDEVRTQAFWREVALTTKAASEWPGFIRMIAFFDGAANWALAFWKTPEAARAFAQSLPHTAAMAEMDEKKFEYTHYAGLWQPMSQRTREAYCELCGAETFMPAERCSACGNPIADVFAPARVTARS